MHFRSDPLLHQDRLPSVPLPEGNAGGFHPPAPPNVRLVEYHD